MKWHEDFSLYKAVCGRLCAFDIARGEVVYFTENVRGESRDKTESANGTRGRIDGKGA